jgi:hypothetical protein
VSRPQVIDDEEHERVHERVAAVDVAKDTGMVCTRSPHPSRPGARQSTVWMVKARMAAIRTLGRQLMEATPDYWRIWLRREAPCCIPGVAGRNLEDIPGSDGLLKIRKVKGTIACQETSGRADAHGRRAGKTRVILAKAILPEP